MSDEQRRKIGLRTQVAVDCQAPPPVVFGVLVDLRAHLTWSGERATDEGNKLLSLDAPAGIAAVGTEFTSTGTAGRDTFHDRSIVTEVSSPELLTIETRSRLERRRRPPWEARFIHRYDVTPNGSGSTITFTEHVVDGNYVPYWLHPLVRPVFRIFVTRADRQQLGNLARLAEERMRAGDPPRPRKGRRSAHPGPIEP
jgi:hypothetical protein